MNMIRKLLALLLALLLPATALAEVYEGTTTALSTQTVTAGTAGTVEAISVAAGDRVSAGDALVLYRPERTFAQQDGSVSLIYADEGDEVDGAVLSLLPYERYTIHCTVEKAYQSAEATLVHEGETVYIRCTSDGTHRAVGILTQIDGEEYRVMTLGGELYLGEAVYLYRDADFSSQQRVGIGTVVSSDPIDCEASGVLTRLCVAEGDSVERGQLLFELNGGSAEAPVSGIVTRVDVAEGDAVQEDQVIAEIVPDGQVAVAIQVEQADAARILPGQRAEMTPAYLDGEAALGGTVTGSTWVAEDGLYTVWIQPDEGVELPLGMSVTVRI